MKCKQVVLGPNFESTGTFKRDAEWTLEKGSRVIALLQFRVNLLSALHKELIMINAYMFCQKIKAFINFNFYFIFSVLVHSLRH